MTFNPFKTLTAALAVALLAAPAWCGGRARAERELHRAHRGGRGEVFDGSRSRRSGSVVDAGSRPSLDKPRRHGSHSKPRVSKKDWEDIKDAGAVSPLGKKKESKPAHPEGLGLGTKIGLVASSMMMNLGIVGAVAGLAFFGLPFALLGAGLFLAGAALGGLLFPEEAMAGGGEDGGGAASEPEEGRGPAADAVSDEVPAGQASEDEAEKGQEDDSEGGSDAGSDEGEAEDGEEGYDDEAPEDVEVEPEGVD